jgi:hypothetical protein
MSDESSEEGSFFDSTWSVWNRYTSLIYTSNCRTLRTDLVDMVETFDIVHLTSRKSKRRSWMRTVEDVQIYVPKTSGMIDIA